MSAEADSTKILILLIYIFNKMGLLILESVNSLTH